MYTSEAHTQQYLREIGYRERQVSTRHTQAGERCREERGRMGGERSRAGRAGREGAGRAGKGSGTEEK